MRHFRTQLAALLLATTFVGLSMPTESYAASVGLVTLHNFGPCPAGIPAGPINPDAAIACNPNTDNPNPNTDGAFPVSSLTLANDGRLFGATTAGFTQVVCSPLPPYGCSGYLDLGSVFSVDTQGTLSSISMGKTFGPFLNSYDGNLYGVFTNGTFNRIAAGQETLIASTGYRTSHGTLAQANDGIFYGVDYTNSYGSNPDPYGALFSVTSVDVVTRLHAFTALTNGTNADGENPWAGMAVGTDGNLYGTTTEGGAYGFGTIFQLTPSGQLTTLHSFNGSTDGSQSMGQLLLGNDGYFYGTTYSGGAYGDGTVFKVATDGTFTVLHNFTFNDGANPKSGLVQQGWTFYGATSSGGVNGTGTIFKMSSTGRVTTLYSFSNLLGGVNSDGAIPNGVVLGQDKNLYGTAEIGGANGTGSVFKLITQRPALTIRFSPARVSTYQNTTLTWSSTSATSCTASGAWSGTQALSGALTISQPATGTYSYTLTCTGPVGSVSRTAKLTVH